VILAAGLSGLATLVRPEGALLLATVVGWTWLRRRHRVWLAAVAGSLPVLIAGALIFWRYGSPLPNSVAAKQVAYQSPWPLENTVALLVQAGLPGWSTYLLAAVPSAVGLVVAAHLRGREVAERIQLMMEYTPAPPFTSGSPASASAALVADVRIAARNNREQRRQIAERAAARLQT